jgi:hypothetical protein
MGIRDTGRGARGNPGSVVALLDKRDAGLGAEWMEALVMYGMLGYELDGIVSDSGAQWVEALVDIFADMSCQAIKQTIIASDFLCTTD